MLPSCPVVVGTINTDRYAAYSGWLAATWLRPVEDVGVPVHVGGMSNQENLRQGPSSSTSADTAGSVAVLAGRSAPGRSARIRLATTVRFSEDDGSGRVGGYGATRRCSPTAAVVVGIPGGMNADEIPDDVSDQRTGGRAERVVTREGLKAVVLGLVDVVQLSGAPHWVTAAVVVARAGVRFWPSSPSR